MELDVIDIYREVKRWCKTKAI